MTNKIARVLLHISRDTLGTLYYFLYNLNSEVSTKVETTLVNTSITRTLYLYLIAFYSAMRDQDFDHTRLHIPEDKFRQLPLNSDNTTPEFPSPDSSSTYKSLSSPPDSPESTARQVSTRSRISYTTPNIRHRSQPSQSPNPKSNPTTHRKQTFSQIPSFYLPNT
ncbi:hypothetical protein N7470_002626 [Penicillium chermesinum]|nr:hypothetical protein N7470_002626 [Penicillium chermesinum]